MIPYQPENNLFEVKDTIIWLASRGFRWFLGGFSWFQMVQVVSGGFRSFLVLVSTTITWMRSDFFKKHYPIFRFSFN